MEQLDMCDCFPDENDLLNYAGEIDCPKAVACLDKVTNPQWYDGELIDEYDEYLEIADKFFKKVGIEEAKTIASSYLGNIYCVKRFIGQVIYLIETEHKTDKKKLKWINHNIGKIFDLLDNRARIPILKYSTLMLTLEEVKCIYAYCLLYEQKFTDIFDAALLRKIKHGHHPALILKEIRNAIDYVRGNIKG